MLQAYEALCGKLKELSSLGGISGLLGWDEMVMMPSGAAGSRGAQKEVLAGVIYDKARAACRVRQQACDQARLPPPAP